MQLPIRYAPTLSLAISDGRNRGRFREQRSSLEALARAATKRLFASAA